MTKRGLKALVKPILLSPYGTSARERKWTTQGLGMLRTYLTDDKTVRLHVWDPALQTGASEIHTHPWDMHSTVVAGYVLNVKYKERDIFGGEHWSQTILCGAGGGLCEKPKIVDLKPDVYEIVTEGCSYEQRAAEIHVSKPEPGTVTVVERTFGTDVDHAKVYWPVGQEWVDAEPRAATWSEVNHACCLALKEWFV